MALTSFTNDPAQAAQFVRCAEELYCDDRNWIPPFRDEKIREIISCSFASNRSGSSYRHFLAWSGGRVVGRLSAFINPLLRNDHGEQVATIGNFESIDDPSVSNDLFDAARAWIRETSGCRIIWGPMNYDIWHGYRLMTRGFERVPFCSEPYNKPYYPVLFERAGFRVVQTWNSVELTGREAIEEALRRGKDRYEKVLEKGYRFCPFDTKRSERDMLNLYDVLNRSFSCFLGYTPTRFPEFRRVFGPNKVAIDPPIFVFARDAEDRLCGLAGSFVDVSDGVRSMRGRTTTMARARFAVNRAMSRRAIFYLGGITPEEATKRAGLGRAAFYHVLSQALRRGYTSVVVALMAQGNVVRGVLNGRGASAEREYALYQYATA